MSKCVELPVPVKGGPDFSDPADISNVSTKKLVLTTGLNGTVQLWGSYAENGVYSYVTTLKDGSDTVEFTLPWVRLRQTNDGQKSSSVAAVTLCGDSTETFCTPAGEPLPEGLSVSYDISSLSSNISVFIQGLSGNKSVIVLEGSADNVNFEPLATFKTSDFSGSGPLVNLYAPVDYVRFRSIDPLNAIVTVCAEAASVVPEETFGNEVTVVLSPGDRVDNIRVFETWEAAVAALQAFPNGLKKSLAIGGNTPVTIPPGEWDLNNTGVIDGRDCGFRRAKGITCQGTLLDVYKIDIDARFNIDKNGSDVIPLPQFARRISCFDLGRTLYNSIGTAALLTAWAGFTLHHRGGFIGANGVIKVDGVINYFAEESTLNVGQGFPLLGKNAFEDLLGLGFSTVTLNSSSAAAFARAIDDLDYTGTVLFNTLAAPPTLNFTRGDTDVSVVGETTVINPPAAITGTLPAPHRLLRGQSILFINDPDPGDELTVVTVVIDGGGSPLGTDTMSGVSSRLEYYCDGTKWYNVRD